MSNNLPVLRDAGPAKLASFAVGVIAGLLGAYALIRKIVS